MDIKGFVQKARQTYQSREILKVALFERLLTFGVPGGVASIIAELVVGVVMLFVGLFMLDAVYTAIAINNSSVFWGISSGLVTTSGTIFTVLGFVIIVIALATAVGSLKSMV